MAQRGAVVLAGPPGAGKSTIAGLLAAGAPDMVVVDKDVVTGAVVDAALRAAGVPHLDRDGEYYRRHLSRACYAATEAVAGSVVANGSVPVLVAPYEGTIDDPGWAAELEGRLAVGRLVAVWVVAHPAVLRRRLAERCEPRDATKLASGSGMRSHRGPLERPGWEHLLVDTTDLRIDDLGEPASHIHEVLERPATSSHTPDRWDTSHSTTGGRC